MKLGEFELDNIYNVDCYEAIKSIPDHSIDLVYCDIPYDIEDNGKGGCFGEKKRDYHQEYYKVCEKEGASRIYKSTMKYVNNITPIVYGIDYSILDEFVRVCKHIYCYIWCSKKQLLPHMQYFVGERNCRFEILTWHKTNPIPTCNGKYLSDTEYCLLVRENGKTKIGGTFETKSKYYLSAINKTDKDRFEHSTIKPLKFVQDHILNSTNEGDIVLDPFAGSGTSLVAAKNLGRHYLGFEIEKRWCDIARNRLNNIQADGQMTIFTM